jgi:hypothetical protein
VQTENKLDIMMHDNEKGTCVNWCCNLGGQKCDQERRCEDSNI